MQPVIKLKKISILFLLLLGFLSGKAQLDNSFLYTPETDSMVSKNARFGFIIDNMNYVRNTEYHTVIEAGATWAGTQIWPQGVFRFTPNLTFKGGAFLQKDFGNNKFRTLIPTYTVSYTKKNLKVNFGTLDGGLDHNLIEPLYAIENNIDRRIENGLQFKGQKNRLKFDVWVDWRTMIYRTSNFQEQFTVGISSKYFLVNKPDFSWSVPLQITGHHKGGEIYTYPHDNISTRFNIAVGTQITKNMQGAALDKVEFSAYQLFYEDLSPTKSDSFIDGNGTYVNLLLQKNHFGVMLNYLETFQFMSPMGEPLYLSNNRSGNGDYLQYRKMAMLRLLYNLELAKNCYLVARMTNVYDFSENEYNNAIEIYLKINIGNKPGNLISLYQPK